MSTAAQEQALFLALDVHTRQQTRRLVLLASCYYELRGHSKRLCSSYQCELSGPMSANIHINGSSQRMLQGYPNLTCVIWRDSWLPRSSVM